MKTYLLIFIGLWSTIFVSCGPNKKDSQSNLLNAADDAKQFALTLYGDEVKVIASGDLLANGKLSAIGAIVRKQTDNSYWIQRGSFMQKESGGWKVLLKMEGKLSIPSGELVSQVDAVNGYIINFDTVSKPVSINIVMADQYGKASSDDAVIRWNTAKNEFEFAAPYDEVPQ